MLTVSTGGTTKKITLEVTGDKVRRLSFDQLATLIQGIDKGIEVQVGDQGRRFVVLTLSDADAQIDALAASGIQIVKLKRH
jgi:hypothetical protein